MTWIQTFTGKKFDLLNVDVNLVDLNDIAHSLSRICRFNGHTLTHYSVAQHCVLGARQVLEVHKSARLALAFLLHDAHEAYALDVPSPIKKLLRLESDVYDRFEQRVQSAVAQKFQVEKLIKHPIVKHYDLVMLATEKRDLMSKCPEAWDDSLPPPLKDKITEWNCDYAADLYRQLSQQLVLLCVAQRNQAFSCEDM